MTLDFIACVLALMAKVVNRDRKNGMVVSISDGKQSEVPPDHMASFPQFVEIVARIAMQVHDKEGWWESVLFEKKK